MNLVIQKKIKKKSALAPIRAIGLGIAAPTFTSPQENTLRFILENFDLQENTRNLYKRIFANPSIQSRRFALKELAETREDNLDLINKRYREAAVSLSMESLNKALAQAGVSAHSLDFLVTATCTGYSCPGLSSHLVEKARLKHDIRLADLAGMGCGAALPALEQALNFVKAHPLAIAAVVCTEICSATFFSNNDPDIVISNALFADGSAAVVLKRDDKRLPIFLSFSSLTFPEWRDSLRFDTEQGRLKNVLGRHVPAQAAQAIRSLVERLLQNAGLHFDQIKHWMVHPGGEKVLAAIQRIFELDPRFLRASRAVLREYGNMSSPSVLFVLEEEMKINPPGPGELGLMISFGAGFTAHGALVKF